MNQHDLPEEERFWRKVRRTDSCWYWEGSKFNAGYGAFHRKGTGAKNVYAHRYSYELAKGVIPEGLQIDHLCRNRACVNPEHLEAVTQQENLRRGSEARKALTAQ